MVGDASEVHPVGREPEDAPTWMEVDRSGLPTVRCSQRQTTMTSAHSRALLGDWQLDVGAPHGASK
jgi:hypothetical protein